MAVATPSRRALVDLPVNTFGTPTGSAAKLIATMGRKRHISEVDEPHLPEPGSARRDLSTDSASTLKDDHTSRETHAPRHQSSLLTITDPATLTPQTPEPTETATGDEDSQHSYNLSSLIDFDPDTTTISQETVATEVTQAPRSRARERAETLRLRLRLAHYKVLTNQINTPFSQLVIHPLSPHTQTPQQPIQEETPEPSLPRLLPAPVLQQSTHLPSSPPNSQGSTSPEKEIGTGEEREAFRTPALPRQRGAIRQTSSPPDSSEKYVRGSGRKDGELSSSVIKSKAAMSLMGLSVGQC